MGESIKYVHAERGEGVKEMANFAYDSTERLSEMLIQGGGRDKNSQKFGCVLHGYPLKVDDDST